ncbi:hypothetical protein PB2503_02162 [Parvularcula bermudensis HTCC2503]|uniref:DUF983 domain-containing protein n=1 Tax=Parvularcula bermudensis (strain ATCC BAA-594 / HTCC2503 / KCTC 12087) TaxID=314260 RepID=E0TC78_PARBH|nr:DUF983 domain-containing protein [Parvularcula bermudensis]ADM08511.1 hypothetical protein PB2503_02162 [Parvularcula bermudensis HTCC2503]
MVDPEPYYPPLSPFQTGLSSKCPRCGRGDLYDGFLSLKSECPRCGLDYTKADAGDGPAVFIMFITGTIGVCFAMVLRFGFGAPEWLVLLLAIFIILGLSLALLRPMKGVLVALQFRNKAREGRIE